MSNLFNVSTSTIARWRTQNRIKGIEVSQRKFYYTQQDIDRLLVPEVNIKIDKTDITAEPRKINMIFSKLEEQNLDRKVFNIELGNLPADIAEKYIIELVEKMKKHFPPSDG